MTFPTYPEYEDSGITWVGAMPSHWQVRRLKFLFDLMKRPPLTNDEVVTAFRDGVVTLRINRRADGYTNSLQEIGYQGVRAGDLVIHAMDAFAGAVGVSDSDGKSTPVYSVCRAKPDSHAWYYGRLLRHMALSGFIASLSKGIRERSTEFRWAEAGNVVLPVPPLSEQQAIASFLDREVGKIDALVVEQEKLIDLLKEKRQAVVSHAVTKGLDSNVPMKDSGVEWLGEVPEHWQIVPLKRIARIGNGSTPRRDELRYWDEGTYPWLNSSVVNEDEVTSSVNFVTEAALAECSLPRIKPPAVLVGITGEGRTRGMATTLSFEATINQHVAYVKPLDARADIGYLRHFFDMAYDRLRYESEGAGSTKGAITCEQLGQTKIPLPPLCEQLSISEALTEGLKSISSLASEAHNAIELLKERRTAVISAAVTGKIDVRGVVDAVSSTSEALEPV